MSKKKKIYIIIFMVLLVIIAATAGILAVQRIDDNDIQIEGNDKYTKEELISYLFEDKWDRNPYVLYYNTKYKEQKKIPFVDKYSVSITSLHSVKITIYEKKMIGYVTYMGSNMYFDKDGTVVESSGKVLEGIPQITGLDFESIIINETLPVQNEDVFHLILDTTQLLKKYEIKADRIYITDSDMVNLYIENVKVELGDDKDLNDKMRSLRDLLPNLAGLSGTLDMKEYSESGYTFKKS